MLTSSPSGTRGRARTKSLLSYPGEPSRSPSPSRGTDTIQTDPQLRGAKPAERSRPTRRTPLQPLLPPGANSHGHRLPATNSDADLAERCAPKTAVIRRALNPPLSPDESGPAVAHEPSPFGWTDRRGRQGPRTQTKLPPCAGEASKLSARMPSLRPYKAHMTNSELLQDPVSVPLTEHGVNKQPQVLQGMQG
ncbi:hypothetical protein SKAU_G00337050 [Synaphobranchus kaupii]|uniref:Uncharacterized protein n=1 Tax=Synaphobranchus kaupii TaxID=118154 RepID=A0A9Q1IJ57_SYNKA|nr:hypothetical protein SKAU_G00337050 [Synaphobranchus kaupii]